MQAVDAIRNIAFCGHGTSGKTTLVDRLLNLTGAVNRPGSVDDRSSICDFDPEEKEHRYSIDAAIVHLSHAGQWFNLIDTPGYPDFIGQTICALNGVETAAVVINAHAGIQVNTRRVFKEAGKLGLGRVLVINRLDGDNIDFPALLASIQKSFGNQCVPLNLPSGTGEAFRAVVSCLNPPAGAQAVLDPAAIREKLIETVIGVDEEVMTRYLEGEPPTDEEVARLLVEAVSKGEVIPIVCCSSKSGVGLPELLDALALCAVPPDKLPRQAADSAGQAVQVKADPNGPLVARVFKTRVDPFVQKISYVRIYSGKLLSNTTVPSPSARKGIKLAQVYRVQANDLQPCEGAGPGDIVAVTKQEDLHTNMSLGDLELPPMQFPTPMVGLAVTPKSRGDEAKLSQALHKITEEDPTFKIDRDSQTKELVMNGMSELHLLLVQEKLKRRDKVEVETKEPKIPYRETIAANAEGMYRHKKQTGGRGQFGEVHIRMYPFPRTVTAEDFATKQRFPSLKSFHYDEKHHFLWVDSVVGGTIPGNFLPAIEKGFKDRLDRGVIAGYQVQDVCVEVHFGKHHPVDSSEAAFKMAGSMAFRNVFQQAKPSLLEPVVKLEITVPAANVGDVYSDMSSRRGRVQGTDAAGDMQTVYAEVPLAEVTTYARTLSSMTGGQGSYTMEFSHYEVVPGNVQQEIISKAKLEEEEEE